MSRQSKEWSDCHKLADELTARTCFEFVPRGQTSAIGAKLRQDRARSYGDVGLDFRCSVIRWQGGDGHLQIRGLSDHRVEVFGRGWLADLIEAIVDRIGEGGGLVGAGRRLSARE